MAWDTIYDLFNSTLEADKPLVTQVLTDIKGQIEQKTADNDIKEFTFNMSDFIFKDGNNAEIIVEAKQLDRIRDQVQFTLRSVGIRCRIPFFSPTNQFNLNYQNAGNVVFYISWEIRDDREFMKQYY